MADARGGGGWGGRGLIKGGVTCLDEGKINNGKEELGGSAEGGRLKSENERLD